MTANSPQLSISFYRQGKLSQLCSPSKGPHTPDGAEWRLIGSEMKPWVWGLPIPLGNSRSAAAA